MKLGKATFKLSTCWSSIFSAYKKYVTRDATVLEIGASTPRNTRILKRYCKQVIGVEYFQKRVPADKPGITYKVGDWQKLSDVIEPESIDLAFSTHVIEHVADDAKALAELYRCLKPGGVALINTPNRTRLPRILLEIFTGPKVFPDAHSEHEREYTESDLQTLLSQSPFKKYVIKPVTIGLHGGPVYVYLETVPNFLRRYTNFWEIHLFKN